MPDEVKRQVPNKICVGLLVANAHAIGRVCELMPFRFPFNQLPVEAKAVSIICLAASSHPIDDRHYRELEQYPLLCSARGLRYGSLARCDYIVVSPFL